MNTCFSKRYAMNGIVGCLKAALKLLNFDRIWKQMINGNYLDVTYLVSTTYLHLLYTNVFRLN